MPQTENTYRVHLYPVIKVSFKMEAADPKEAVRRAVSIFEQMPSQIAGENDGTTDDVVIVDLLNAEGEPCETETLVLSEQLND